MRRTRTGKSYVTQEVSPYSALMTGPTTVANLFGHMGGRSKGLVQIWDVVGFDEVADLEKMPKEVITTMKTYCESGQYQRGQEAATGEASIAMFGNTNQPIDVMVQTGHLFEPMPTVIRDDMAFIDRLHFYLPGWEIPKMRNELFTDHYGFVVDYLAEALRELRRHNFTEISDRHFSMGSHLVARDRKAVKKTVSGADEDRLPTWPRDARRNRRTARIRDGRTPTRQGAAQEDGLLRILPDVVQLFGRGDRRRAFRRRSRTGRTKPDLVRPAGAGQRLHRDRGGRRNRRHVSGRGLGVFRVRKIAHRRRDLRSDEGIDQSRLQLHAGQKERPFDREGTRRQRSPRRSHRSPKQPRRGRDRSWIFRGGVFGVEKGAADRRPSNHGDLSVQGNIKGLRSLVEPLQVAMDNGAKRALIPLENKRNFLDVTGDIMEHVDPIFFGDPKTAALKALGLT